MYPFLFVKWLHIVSSTVLFGFGAGTAWYFWNAHLTGNPALIARVGRMVVKADWIFTGTSGVVQPLTGLILVHFLGYSLLEPWLIATYGLYLVAFACWVPVVWLQIKATRLAEASLISGAPLGTNYRRTMHMWFSLGWPAFLSLMGVFWLMIAKPTL